MSTPPTSTSALAAGPDPLDRQARVHLAAERFRKARDDLKLLCKKDRARYLPLLIEANVGLARQLMDKGFPDNAQQVIEHLKTLAAPEIVAALELRLSEKTGNLGQQLPRVVRLLGDRSSTLSSADRTRWADQLVLTFAAVPSSTAEDLEVAADVAAIQEGLEALSGGDFARALERTARVGRASAFSHWRLFIKGLVAFHITENDKALAAFERLPEDSVTARAALAYRIILEPGSRVLNSANEAVLQTVAALIGQPAIGRLLAKAEQAWRLGDLIASYRVFRDGLSDFPTEGLGLTGLLSEFYFKSLRSQTEAKFDDCSDYFLGIEDSKATKNEVEIAWICRTLSLLLVETLHPEILQEKWSRFIAVREKRHGVQAGFQSQAWTWLGRALSKMRRQQWGERKARMKDPEGATESLRKAMALDPKNVAAHLQLCDVYEALGKTSERDRLLDRMVTQFPQNKAVVVRAGAGCLLRKAYLKAATCFEVALEWDPLDSHVADQLCESRIWFAAQQFKNGRADRGRHVLEKNSPLLLLQPDNLVRSAWCHSAHRAVFETAHGDLAMGTRYIQEAVAQASAPAAAWYFAHLAWRHFSGRTASQTPYEAAWNSSIRAGPDAPTAVSLARIFIHWDLIFDHAGMERELKWLVQYLDAALKISIPPGIARQLVEILAHKLRFRSVVCRIIEAQDAKDPFFRFFRFRLNLYERDDGEEDDSMHLKQIVADASRQGDSQTIKLAREALSELDQNGEMLPYGEEEPDDGDSLDGALDGALDPTSDTRNELGPLVDIIAKMARLDPDELRRTRPKGIPEEALEAMIALANGNVPAPATGDSLPKPKLGARSAPEWDQMEFF